MNMLPPTPSSFQGERNEDTEAWNRTTAVALSPLASSLWISEEISCTWTRQMDTNNLSSDVLFNSHVISLFICCSLTRFTQCLTHTEGSDCNILCLYVDNRQGFLQSPTFTTFILPTQTQRHDTGFDFGCLLCCLLHSKVTKAEEMAIGRNKTGQQM